MSLLSRTIDQYCRCLDWNIPTDIFLWGSIYLEEIEGIDHTGTKRPQTSRIGQSGKHKETNKCLRVVWGQRNKSAANYSFLSCLVISICPPRTPCPSITFHSRQDSCLGVKHIHSSAVHQIAPNTVILHSGWAQGGGGAARENASRRQRHIGGPCFA